MKKIFTSLGLALAAFLSASPASAGIVVTFTPSTQHASIGSLAWVDVNIAGLGSQILSGVDLNFLYSNSTVMGSSRFFDAMTLQGQMGGTNLTWVIDSTADGNWGLKVNSTLTDAELAAAQDDAFLLARFNFLADADGVSLFTLGPDQDPVFQRKFVGLGGQTLDVTINGACIAVGTGVCSMNVPEPGSFGLAGLALLGAFAPAALRRRKQPR